MDKKLLMLGILPLLIIAGCTEGGLGRGKKTPITEVDVRKGTDGIKMEFLPNAPPQNVFAESGFPVSLKIKNAGAFDIVENKGTPEIEKGIAVFGFEKAYVSFAEKLDDLNSGDLEGLSDAIVNKLTNEEKSSNDLQEKLLLIILQRVSSDELKNLPSKQLADLADKVVVKTGLNPTKLEEYKQRLSNVLKNVKERQEMEIKGKSIYSPSGDEEFISINARAGKIGPQSETHPSAIFATACYPYETIFGASVCIDTDIIGESKGKACIAKDLAFTNGQGAPVAVTKVETRMLPQDDGKIKPHFLIYVKNAGNGEVVNLSKVEAACTSAALDYKDFNTITVNAALSGVPLRCSEDIGAVPGPTMVRLREKEDLIRCTYDKDGGIDAGLDAYVAPLKVELDYGYTFTISKNIIIEKVLTH